MTRKLLHIAGTTGLTLAILAGISFMANTASAASGAELLTRSWSHEGIFGSYDKAAARRGLDIYRNTCAGCHSLDLVTYRTLVDIGLTEEEAKEIASEAYFEDALDEDGYPMERPGILADHFMAPFPNEVAARASNNGAYPPDLSLITKARADGVNYLYSLLLGYTDLDEHPDAAPEDFELMDGMSFNAYFPDHQIAMGQPLFEEDYDNADGEPATLEESAADIAVFLAWAAEPKLDERKTLGAKVMIFLFLFTILAWFTNRRVWRDVK